MPYDQILADNQAEESYLAGKLALDDAFNHFQSDLFMSSLTESSMSWDCMISSCADSYSDSHANGQSWKEG